MSEASKKDFTHISRIKETEDGYLDIIHACEKCSLAGADCRRYTGAARVQYGLGEACFRCRAQHSACNIEETESPSDETLSATAKKIKRASFRKAVVEERGPQEADPGTEQGESSDSSHTSK